MMKNFFLIINLLFCLKASGQNSIHFWAEEGFLLYSESAKFGDSTALPFVVLFMPNKLNH